MQLQQLLQLQQHIIGHFIHKGETLLHTISRYECMGPKCCQILLESGRGFSACLELQNSRGETPLMVACAHANVLCTRLFLEYFANVHVRDNLGRTALMHLELTGTSDPRPYSMLIRYGSDFSAVDHPDT